MNKYKNIIIEEFTTKHYRCIPLDSPAACGYFIERHRDKLTTPLNVGFEGLEGYAELKAAFKKKRALFDALASEHFVRGSTVYNVAGEMGWVGEDGRFCK